MPDYLEEALDNLRDLLDQVKRLERELSSGGAAETGTLQAFPSAAEGESLREEERPPAGNGVSEQEEDTLINQKYDPVYRWEERNRRREELPLEAGPGAERASGEPEARRQTWAPPELEAPRWVPTPLEVEEGEASPLLAQLERLDRAVSPAPAGAAPGRRAAPVPWPGSFALSKPGTAGPDVPGGAEGLPGMGRGSENASLQGAEGLRWAEQADRAFRRDSRRYDGGFYLY